MPFLNIRVSTLVRLKVKLVPPELAPDTTITPLALTGAIVKFVEGNIPLALLDPVLFNGRLSTPAPPLIL